MPRRPEGLNVSEDKLKIAVFIDFDNIEIGVKSTLGQYFDVGTVLEAIKERGEIVTKIAYGDWTRAGDYGRAMSQHAIHMVQRNLTPGGDKNGADINLALDALEMAFTHNHINSFVIVGGDSDFISLVEKLKQYDRKVFVVGGRAFTSVVMQKNCTEFIAYENLVNRGRPAPARGVKSRDGELAQAMPLVRRALKLLADREVLPQLGLLKSTLLQLDSAFSERDYGAGSFRDFVQKLAHAGFVALKGSDRSFHVELRDAGETAAASHTASTPSQTVPLTAPPAPSPSIPPEPAPPADGEAEPAADEQSAGESLRLRQLDGYQIVQTALLRPGIVSRWPLYVRQVRQIIRQYDDQFDEKRFGFGGIVDALRFAQREGLLRLDRDRQGVVRVYPGPQFPRATAPGTAAGISETPEADAVDVAYAAPAFDGPTNVAAGESSIELSPGDTTPETIEPDVTDTPRGAPGLAVDGEAAADTTTINTGTEVIDAAVVEEPAPETAAAGGQSPGRATQRRPRQTARTSRTRQTAGVRKKVAVEPRPRRTKGTRDGRAKEPAE